jgi:outer membrane immunogenic protein
MNNRSLFVVLTAALATSALSSFASPSMVSAADLPPAAAPSVYAKAPMISPAINWSGFYGGVNLGYGWGSGDMSLADVTPGDPGNSGFPPTPQSVGNRSNGVIGGGQVGYNWQMGSLVTGLEADIQGSGIKGTAQAPLATFGLGDLSAVASGSSEQKLSWFGTVRGRVGVTVTPDLLLFGTGGLAYGNVSHSGNATFTFAGDPTIFGFPVQSSQTKIGWAAGAGAEWMFARNWSANVEYLHIDLGGSSAVGGTVINGTPFLISPDAVSYHWHNSFDTVRAGVNYHFN